MTQQDNQECTIQKLMSDEDSYKIDDEYIGKGGQSIIKAILKKVGSSNMAIKITNYKNKQESKRQIGYNDEYIENEKQIHQRMKHPNILKFYDQYKDQSMTYTLIELAEQGNLYQYLNYQKKKKFTEEEYFPIFFQICLALDYMHQCEITHRAIRAENVLLDKFNNVKICDFEDSCYVRDILKFKLMVDQDQMNRNSPDLQRINYNQKVDIWSLGYMSYEMLHGYQYDQNKPFDLNLSQDVTKLLKKLLSFSPNDRPEFRSIFGDAWVKKNIRGFDMNFLLQGRFHKNLSSLYQLINETQNQEIIQKYLNAINQDERYSENSSVRNSQRLSANQSTNFDVESQNKIPLKPAENLIEIKSNSMVYCNSGQYHPQEQSFQNTEPPEKSRKSSIFECNPNCTTPRNSNNKIFDQPIKKVYQQENNQTQNNIKQQAISKPPQQEKKSVIVKSNKNFVKKYNAINFEQLNVKIDSEYQQRKNTIETELPQKKIPQYYLNYFEEMEQKQLRLTEAENRNYLISNKKHVGIKQMIQDYESLCHSDIYQSQSKSVQKLVSSKNKNNQHQNLNVSPSEWSPQNEIKKENYNTNQIIDEVLKYNQSEYQVNLNETIMQSQNLSQNYSPINQNQYESGKYLASTAHIQINQDLEEQPFGQFEEQPFGVPSHNNYDDEDIAYDYSKKIIHNF